MLIYYYIVCVLLSGSSALFRLSVPRIVEIKQTGQVYISRNDIDVDMNANTKNANGILRYIGEATIDYYGVGEKIPVH